MRILEAKNIDLHQLKQKLFNASVNHLVNCEGFESKQDVLDFLYPVVDVRREGDAVVAEIRAEIDYECLFELGTVLDRIVQKYDPDAYFEPVQPGITRAYLNI